MALALVLALAPAAWAKIPEPHHVVYGAVTVDGAAATRGVVELVPAGSTEPIASFVIGSQPGAEGMYVLRVPIDALYPRVAGTARPGEQTQVFVNGLWGGDATIGEKGTYQELALEATSEHRIVFRAGPAGAPDPVESGGTAGVGVLARDTLGHSLSHAWSALCPGLPNAGSFADASKAATLWTAPANLTGDRQGCTLTVMVADGQGLSESRSYSQGVLALPDRVALVSGPAGTPNPVASGGLVTLSAAAQDSYGHAVNFVWSAQCTGLEGNGSFATTNGTTTWKAPGNYTGERHECRLQVVASDGFGHGAQESYVQRVNADAHAILIVSAPAGVPNPTQPGGVASLSVAASDSLGHSLRYAWRAQCTGLSGNGTFEDATSRTPRWTAPGKSAAGPGECRMEVRIQDGQGASRVAGYRQVVSDGRPVAVAAASAASVACPGQIAFDGTGSYHPSGARRIVRWEWDFHHERGDFRPEATGPTAAYAYGDVGPHTVALRVSDDAPVPAWGMATLEVRSEGAAPTAVAGGPYTIGYGSPLALDGTQSSDSDIACGDRVEEYAWDLDDDGEYDDAAGVRPLLSWGQVRQVLCGGSCEVGMAYPVALRVSDRLGLEGESAAQVTIGALNVPIRLATPNGGEVLGTRRAAALRFVSGAGVEAVQVLLRRGGGPWRTALPTGGYWTLGTAEGGAVVEGQRLWKVPLKLGGTYRDYTLKVVGYAGEVEVGSDESDGALGIGPVELTAPRAGEVLAGGRRATVRWSQYGTARPVAAVRIRYTVDGGTSWRLAGIARAAAREFSWRVPALKARSERCRVTVDLLSATGSVLGRDAGTGPFTVTGGVELTGPEAGDLVYGGTGRLVRWQTAATSPVARAGIALSLDGGATWTPLATLSGDPGEYAWDAPAVMEANGQCRLAVTLLDARGGTIARDEGQGLFTIVPRP